MEQQSYYRLLSFDLPDRRSNDFESDEAPLIVNCTGLNKMTRPYLTNIPRGRRDFYLQYCIEGSIEVKHNGRADILSPGQVLVLSPYTPYTCQNLTDFVSYYWVHFTGSDAANLLKRFSFDTNTVLNVGSGERIVRLFRSLFREYLWRDRCFDDASGAALITILAELSRMRDMNTQTGDATAETIYRSLSYFHNHINKPITVAQLAQIEHFSPSRYRTVFRHCMGMSPSEYMTRMRMRRAGELLTMADLSVREVAETCGYPDQLYFSRVFRAHFGVPPSKYRGDDWKETSEKD